MGIFGRLIGGRDQDGLDGKQRQLVRDALAPLDEPQSGLADRAAAFVGDGALPQVLLAVEQVAATPVATADGSSVLPADLLGGPGRLGWFTGSIHGDKRLQKLTSASLHARSRLYRSLPGGDLGPGVLEQLVRLGRVLAAAGGSAVPDTGSGAPTWLQLLVNDATYTAHTRVDEFGRDVRLPAAVDGRWVADLLEVAGTPDTRLAIRAVLERGDARFQQDHLAPLTSAPGTTALLLEHPDEVEAVAGELSAYGRLVLVDVLGGDAGLRSRFAPVLVRLAVDASKTVRTAAGPYLDGVPEQQRIEGLVEVLRTGGAAQRGHAATLLARFPAATARVPLRAALDGEPSATVRRAVTDALERLGAADDAAGVELPAPPPYRQIEDHPLGEDAVRLLRENHAELVEHAHRAVRAADAEGAHHHGRHWAHEHLKQLRSITDAELVHVARVLDGAEPVRSLPERRGHAVDQVVRHGSRLRQLPGWSAAHAVRWVVARGWGHLWLDDEFQRWLLSQERGSVDLRAVADLMAAAGEGHLEIAQAVLSDPSWSVDPLDQLPAQAVWPFFAVHPEHVDRALGLSAPEPEPHRRHADDLGQALRVVGAFPVVPARWLPRVMEVALGEGRTHRATAQDALAAVPDLSARIAASLAHGTAAVRIEAASWLARRGDRDAVPAIRDALARERRETARAAFLTALETLGEDISPYLDPDVLLAEARKGLRAKVPAALSWFPLDALPRCRWTDGSEVDPDVVRWWVVLAAKLKEPRGNALLTRYLDLLDPASRAELGETVLRQFIAHDTRRPTQQEALEHARAEAPATFAQHQQWHRQARSSGWYHGEWDLTMEQVLSQLRAAKLAEYVGSAIAAKGVLALVADTRGGTAVELVRQYMRDHYQRRHQVEAMLEGLAGSDDPAVIQLLLSVSRRYRTASVQERALELVTAVSERRGWSHDQLADRTVPAAGLDDAGRLELSYGDRTFTLTLDAALKPVLRTAEGKVVTTLPPPRQGEDAEQVKAAKAALTAHKKELKQVLELQTARLYEAMCTDRTWPAEEWTEFLHDHPLMGRLVQRLVWLDLGTDGQGAPRAFRPSDDGSLVDVEDDEVRLLPGVVVRLAHATLLDAGERAAWHAHLADYRVVPLFGQLDHLAPELPAPDAHGVTPSVVEDRKGWVTDAFTLRNVLTRRGYQRGETGDGGHFDRYTKLFAAYRVVVSFSGNVLPEENVPAALTTLHVEDARSGGWQPVVVPPAEVPTVLLAEAYADYRAAADASAGFDPAWEKVAPW